MSGLVSKFATVGGASMASRVLGFAREAMIAAFLGAGPVADAFYVCFRLPNLFRRLFAEGAFNIAFVPLFAKELEGGGEEGAKKFARDVFSVLTSWLFVLTLLAIIFMPALFALLVSDVYQQDALKFDNSVLMTRIMFPYLFCMSLVAMLSGILNSLRRYFLAAIVPVLLNIILILVLLFGHFAGFSDWEMGTALAIGVLISGFAQLGFLFWGVHKEGFRFTLKVPRLTPGVRRLMVLMGPSLLTGGVLQINLLVGTIIATAQDGANALLNYADRLNQLPLGVIGIAVGVVLLPELSRALKAGDGAEVQNLQNRSLEFSLALTLPATVGFLVISQDIVALLYERGAFDAQTTVQTSRALVAFATGLPAYVMMKVFQPAFFAREDMRTPFWFSVIMVITNIAVSLLLFPSFGHVGIAIGTSVSAWVNLILLAGTQWRRNDFRPDGLTLRRLFLLLVASILMGAAILLLRIPLANAIEQGGFLIRLFSVGGLIGAGAVIYFGIALISGAIDHGQVKRLLRRKA